ncbi:hypothetical protein BMS3Abin10_01594 [bacterium BMS3Abin10]|nr:hypothetical protein BMS3Abin10_01594 [bacterium BMS3Abin10]
MWWTKGDKVYNVNGVARGNIKKFDLTFDVDTLKAFDKCKKN